ncbi:NAD(P)/FAD-dependent oxidoreductase [Paracoccus benzoatiresistens]|uniref:Thioredoxin reductase n=1 Tax=Paracoccus benzoatiresistens TaxID=2997341 RepID=A0ABT4J5P6_9RHOB|nr:NAD(P)/FAD-dependent oxidoreductase [Paracoccus sp. EF6]MCZ0962452.1 NAD(P)/FAD-dependent oxidoreductase [Paracoccus sp. EF6]
MRQDVIVIGGSYAGMAAALQLLRARRTVLIVDAGQRRNRFAHHSHGFLGQDGMDPAVIWKTAKDQLSHYPTLTWVDGTVVEAKGQKDAFAVTLDEGSVHHGRRLLLASGVRDELPPVPGLTERWGRTVFHCPYCHGYELEMGKIGVIATGSMSLHQAQMLPEWGKVTLLTNGAVEPDDEMRADLSGRGVTIEPTPVAALEGRADVRLRDGRLLGFAGLFTASRAMLPSDLASLLGCEIEEGPLGQLIVTQSSKETSVPGIYACGDAGRMPHSVSLAVGDGAWAGAQLHRSLIF